MRLLNNEKILKEFYEEIKNKHNISIEELKKICDTPWKYLKNKIESGDLTSVRFKFFGVFLIKEKRLQMLLANLDKQLKNKSITLEEYNYYKNILSKKDESNKI